MLNFKADKDKTEVFTDSDALQIAFMEEVPQASL